MTPILKVKKLRTRCDKGTPIISATWEVEIKRVAVQGQPEQKISKTLSQQTGQWRCL
jgi:hypothetical protein